MVHGQEKTREMVRSLLPSKNREAARHARALIHRGARRQSRLEMASLARDPESFEDLAGLDEDVTAEVRWLVSRRRGGDKDAPFRRWASARAQALPQSHRLGFIRALLPPGVIGEHALFHLKHDAAFEHPQVAAHREALQRAWRSRRGPSLDPGEQAELLREVLRAPGGHRAFNQWLKCVAHPAGASERRLLLGEPDVRPFLESLWGPRNGPVRLRSAPRGPFAWLMDGVEAFLRGFKHHRGDAEATLAALQAPRREQEKTRHQREKGYQRSSRTSRRRPPYCAQ